MGAAPTIPRLTRETVGAAGPGRWVNCGVDPMRARGFSPPGAAFKPPFAKSAAHFCEKTGRGALRARVDWLCCGVFGFFEAVVSSRAAGGRIIRLGGSSGRRGCLPCPPASLLGGRAATRETTAFRRGGAGGG